KNQPYLSEYQLEENTEKILIDQNEFSTDGTVAITNFFPDNKNHYIAYTLAESGSDRQRIFIYDTHKQNIIDDKLEWVKFTNISWDTENKGFYYTRFPEVGTVPKEDENNYCQVYWHKIGNKQKDDILIYKNDKRKELNYIPKITADKNYLILSVSKGTSPKNGIYYKKLGTEKDFVKLFEVMDAEYNFIGNKGKIFYFKTDKNSQKGKIISFNIENNQIKEIISEKEEILEKAVFLKNLFFTVYLKDASNIIRVYDINENIINNYDGNIPLTVDQINSDKENKKIVFVIQSYLKVPTVYLYDGNNNKFKIIKETDYDFDFKKYLSEKHFYESKDGTKIPVTVNHKKNIEKDNENKTLLYGYGGFNINMTPVFSPTTLFWLENGGIYAVANLRGGGEYGSTWHEEGMLDKKQNVFDDFISAAEWLISKKYTKKSKLAIWGRSNGGLLVTSVMVQRPSLFGAVIANVPVTDMLRYHKFTVGSYWIPEYGDPDKKEDFKYLYDYSPLHNLEKGEEYPPAIVATGDTDDRVVPLHSRKFLAALKDADSGNKVKLFRMEKKAGHGFGKPTSKIIEERRDFYSFLLNELK
ncbi:MAG TPA: prolyl oligopeptidase family serine peptidase, partial [Halanaerobiales bacterium]|nr:prolyl oligopeptidase family serine peptidase [Halanaerobiales bacterium]